jgi:hypothetical protein
LQQKRRCTQIVSLPRGKHQPNRQAVLVDSNVDLGT